MELNHIPNSVEELIEKTSEMDVSSVISKLRGLGNQVIRKPHYKSKPLPPNEHTSESILNYSKELEEWEKYKEELKPLYETLNSSGCLKKWDQTYFA